jgi:hypothetical protein
MTASPWRTGLCLVGLLAASLVVVAPLRARAHPQNAPRGVRPDVGTVRGTLVVGSGGRPDAGSDVWIFAGKIELPTDCAIFPSTFELTIGDCATRNRSVAFLKHAQADGRGTFEVRDLPIGDYTLVLRSAHVGGTDKRDVGNKFVVSWFLVKGGETIDASTKF